MEPAFPESQQLALPEPRKSDIMIKERTLKKRKALTFREKYQKGQRIGTGPFGNFYKCWNMRESQHAGAENESDSNSIE